MTKAGKLATERLQKLMAKAGLGSRRACEDIIRLGRVTLNGHPATLGMQADPEHDDIRVDGSRLRPQAKPIYVALNKPRGVISDEDVKGNWPRARDLIPLEGHLYPVGRLDLNSEGLMLFTNDGELTHRLTHPRYEHSKTYHVTVEGEPDSKALAAWRRGIILDGEQTARAEVSVIATTREGMLLEVVLREGRKRQLRRVAATLGHPVVSLRRIAIGPLKLGNLQAGEWRLLTEPEIKALEQAREASPRRRPARETPSRRAAQPDEQARKRRPAGVRIGRR